jgi:hypothetical protein
MKYVFILLSSQRLEILLAISLIRKEDKKLTQKTHPMFWLVDDGIIEIRVMFSCVAFLLTGECGMSCLDDRRSIDC